MNVRIKRIDKSLPLPEYKTAGAAGFDLCARVTTTIPPHVVGYIPLNVVIELPKEYYAALVSRSSLHKRGLIPANGFGVFDGDFCGNTDEYTGALLNFTDKEVTILRGERIMQVVLSPVVRVEFDEVDDMGNQNRGGFGTTGDKYDFDPKKESHPKRGGQTHMNDSCDQFFLAVLRFRKMKYSCGAK